MLGNLYLIPMGLIGAGFIVGILKWRTLGPVQRRLACLLCITVAAETVSRTLWKQGINTYPVFHFYAPLQYAFLISLYALATKPFLIKKILTSSIPLMATFSILNATFLQDLQHPNTNVTTSIGLILTFLALWFFFQILTEMRYPRIEKSTMFWLNIGVLVYFSGSTMIFIFQDWLIQVSVEYTLNVWVIHVLLNIIHYLCFNIALWMKPE